MAESQPKSYRLFRTLGQIGRWVLRRKARWLFGCDVEVFGNFTVIDPANVRIGSNCAINHGVFFLGRSGISIGNDVVLSAGCMLIDASLDPTNFADTADRRYVDAPIRVGDGVWIGAGAIILPGITIGEKSIIGAGAVVTRDVPACSVVAGNPASIIGRCGGEQRS